MPSSDKNDKSSKTSSFFKNRKNLYVLLAGIVGIFLIGTIADLFLSRIIKKKIIKSVYESSGHLYFLEMDDFDFKFWTGAVHMSNVKLTQDTIILNRLRKEDPSANLSNVDIDVGDIHITSISWKNYLLNRNLKVGEINVHDPKFFFNAQLPKDTLKVGKKSFLEVLPGLVASFAGSLEIEGINLDKGTLLYNVQGDSGISHQKATDIFLRMKDIRIDTFTVHKALYTKNVDFSLGNYELITSDNLYKLNIGALKGSYVDSMLIADSISLTPLGAAKKSQDHYYAFIKRIKNSRINYSLFFQQNKVALGDMLVENPDIDFTYHQKPSTNSSDSSNGANANFLKAILPYIANTFTMDKFLIQNGKFKSHVFNTKGGSVMQRANEFSLSVESIRIDTTTIKTNQYWHNLKLAMANYESKFDPENVLFKAKSIAIKSRDQSLDLKGVQVIKTNPSDKVEQVFYRNYTDEINVKGILYQGLFTGKGIGFGAVSVKGMKLEIINDEKYANKNPGRMPNEMIKPIPITFNIDHVIFTNAYIKYLTYVKDVKDPGIVTFERANFVFTNFTNDRKKMTEKHPAKIKGEAYVMGKGLFKLEVEVPLLSKNFNCKFKGSLGKMDATYFNSVLESGGMKLESGEVEAQHFDVAVLNGKATGEMILLYYDLNAKLVNKKTGKVKKFLSHIANFILKNENKIKGKEGPRTAVIDYSRKPEDGFLSYIWSSISEGIVKTVVKDFFEPVVKSK